MFNNIKKEIVGMLMLGALTSFVNAVVPNAPGSYVGVTDINCTAVRVNFVDNSNNENGFIVSGNFPSSPIMLPANDATVNPNVYVNITGLDCNTTYNLNIVAYNNGNSDTSTGSFNITTTFGLTNCGNCDNNSTPAQPGPYIGVTDINCTAVRINFADNAINEDGFIVTGNFPNSPMYLPAHTDENSSEVYADITGLESNQTYSIISVVAYNSAGNSTPSDTRLFNIENTFGVTCPNGCNQDVPLAPGSYIGVTDINKTAIRINFLDNSDNEDNFILSISDTNGNRNITITENNVTAPSQTYVNVDGLTCNTTYTVKALASNCKGDSTTSDERVFTIMDTFSIPCP